MTQYINKSALVAEIEKLKWQLLRGACSSQISMETYCKEEAYNEILSYLDTLEVKEVNFDNGLVEEVYSHLDSIKDTADRMTSGNFMRHRAAIKFSANTIAKVLELMGLKIQKGE